MDKIKIAIVDDQNIFRESLGMLIQSIPTFSLIAEAPDGQELLALLQTMNNLPDVLLMDMNMPGMNGIELNEVLAKAFPRIKVIVLSVHSQDRLIAKMISAGAAGYLVKNCDKKELAMAIKSTYETGFYMNQQVIKAIQDNSRNRRQDLHAFHTLPSDLSERETEVLKLICKEQSSGEIAENLFISIRTVEGHRNNLLLKTQSRNTAGLVLFAIRHRIFEVL